LGRAVRTGRIDGPYVRLVRTGLKRDRHENFFAFMGTRGRIIRI